MTTTTMWIILVTLIASSCGHGLGSTATKPPEMDSSPVTSDKLKYLTTLISNDDLSLPELHENATIMLSTEHDGKDVSSTSSPTQTTTAHLLSSRFTTEDASSTTFLENATQKNIAEESLNNEQQLNSTNEGILPETEFQPKTNSSNQSFVLRENISERNGSFTDVNMKKNSGKKTLRKTVSKYKLLYKKRKGNITHAKVDSGSTMKFVKHKLGKVGLIPKFENESEKSFGYTDTLNSTLDTTVNSDYTQAKGAYDLNTILPNTYIIELNETLDASQNEDDESSVTKESISEVFTIEAASEHTEFRFATNDEMKSESNTSEESNSNFTSSPHKIRKRNLEDPTTRSEAISTLETNSTVESNPLEDGRSTHDTMIHTENSDDVNSNFNDSEFRTEKGTTVLNYAKSEENAETEAYFPSEVNHGTSEASMLPSNYTAYDKYEKNTDIPVGEEEIALYPHSASQKRHEIVPVRKEHSAETQSKDFAISHRVTSEATLSVNTDAAHNGTEDGTLQLSNPNNVKNVNFGLEISTSHVVDGTSKHIRIPNADNPTEKYVTNSDTSEKSPQVEEMKSHKLNVGNYLLLDDRLEASDGLSPRTPLLPEDTQTIPQMDGNKTPLNTTYLMEASNVKEIGTEASDTKKYSQPYEQIQDEAVPEFFSTMHASSKVEEMSPFSTLFVEKKLSEDNRVPSLSSNVPYDESDSRTLKDVNGSLTHQKEPELRLGSLADEEKNSSRVPIDSHHIDGSDVQKKGSLFSVNMGNNGVTPVIKKYGENTVMDEKPSESYNKLTTDVEFITEPTVSVADDLPSDYFADQSEVRPVSIELNSKYQSFNDSETKGDIKLMQTNRSKVITNLTSPIISSASQNFENLPVETSAEVSEQNNQPNGTVTLNQGNDANAEVNNSLLSKDGNMKNTLNQSKIAGVGVKTTVSVSLNVSKTNGSSMEKSVQVNVQAENGKIESAVGTQSSNFHPSKDIGNLNNMTAEYNNEEMPINTLKSVTLGTGSRETSTQAEQTTSPSTPSNPFGLRKPRIRLDGEQGPLMNRPRPTRPTPKPRPTPSGPPVMIFQRARTRMDSITSSTTISTTFIASAKSFTRRPWSLAPNFGNISSYIIETETIPTTTEEEEEEEEQPDEIPATDSPVEHILPDDELVVIKVESVIKVDKGLRWNEQLNYRNSPRYRMQSRKVNRMLKLLFQETYIFPRLWKIEIDGFRREKGSKSVGVDYFLYVIKADEELDKSFLISAVNERLVNNTFLLYTLDPASTEFRVLYEEKISKPTVAPESVEPPIPQWAIAVIVIGAASLIFIILFGAVTVYGRHHMRRRYNSKLNDEDMEKAFESKDWESKMGAAYENLAADGIYDIDDGNPENMKKKYYSAERNVRPSRVSRHDSWKSDYYSEPPRRNRRSLDPTIF